MSQERNNVRAGLFVLLGACLLVAVVLVLADFDRLFRPTQSVTARFHLSDGLQGLKVGAPVTIGDVPAGTVTAVEDVPDAQGTGRVLAKDVRFTIPEKYQLYDNAEIELVVPPLGSGTRLNIRGFGQDLGDVAQSETGEQRKGASWVYEPGEVIPGGIAESQLTEQFAEDLGIEDRQRRQIQQIITNVQTLTDTVAGDPERLQEILDNVHALSDSLRQETPAILADVKDSTEDLKALAASARERSDAWFGRIDSITKKAEAALGRIDKLVQTNGPVLTDAIASTRRATGNLEQLSDKAAGPWAETLRTALNDAETAVGNIREVTDQVQSMVTAQRPVLERTIANARLVSDQLKLASIEIRRAPWRLLYEPSEKELETDNLYDAARSFALAASALDNTTSSLEAIVKQHPDKLADNDPNLKLLLDNLHQTFEQLDEAERAFWKQMNKRSDESNP